MIKVRIDGCETQINEGTSVIEYVYLNRIEDKVLAYKINNHIARCDYVFKDGDEAVSVTISSDEGYLIYKETLILLMLDAAEQLYGYEPAIVRQSVNKSTYFELSCPEKDKKKAAEKLKEKMREIIELNRRKTLLHITREEAAELLLRNGQKERSKDISSLPSETVRLYKTAGKYHITYQNIAYSVRAVSNFDIESYENGYLLRYPTNYNTKEIPKINAAGKIHRAIEDYREWINTIGIEDIFSLNRVIREGKSARLINLSEGLHEKRISLIADKIKENKNIKIILIAGPSSSGKTTFANRLCLHLEINHLKPMVISLDDYYVDDERMPRNENGEMDFECVESIDYELFNRHLSLLASGAEVTLPRYDFNVRKSVIGKTIKLEENGVIIVEGIHALNELLTSRVPRENKYKIYLSALTSLCLDEYNAFSPTDNRLLRRLVRDAAFRNTSAEATFDLWKNVRKGEMKYIFPFENEADVVFNSSLVYELSVLKEPATKLLSGISKTSRHYSRARRLIELLNYFEKLSPENIPPTSIMREFVGGSTIL